MANVPIYGRDYGKTGYQMLEEERRRQAALGPNRDSRNQQSPDEMARTALEREAERAAQERDRAMRAYQRDQQVRQKEARYLQSVASGQTSVSAQQLANAADRQARQQQSLAASAGPYNAVAGARTAAMNTGAIRGGLAGQQAVAGVSERNQAMQQLNQMLLEDRQRALGVYQGAGGQQQQSLGTVTGAPPIPGFWDKYGAPIAQGSAALAQALNTSAPQGGGYSSGPDPRGSVDYYNNYSLYGRR